MAKRFYSTTDIMDILSISRTRALEYMHMFEQRGKTFRDGKVFRVEAAAFDQYIRQNTGRI